MMYVMYVECFCYFFYVRGREIIILPQGYLHDIYTIDTQHICNVYNDSLDECSYLMSNHVVIMGENYFLTVLT